MFRIVKRVLCVLLLVFISIAPLACLSINEPADKPKTDVNVGGPHGVVVDHPDADANRR
ncbi:MAG TPA: hypothetical protein VNA25_18520 [Phycisphaerae bacterium]|nr:hypothetical protein [Phycisphaerae bacterium]